MPLFEFGDVTNPLIEWGVPSNGSPWFGDILQGSN